MLDAHKVESQHKSHSSQKLELVVLEAIAKLQEKATVAKILRLAQWRYGQAIVLGELNALLLDMETRNLVVPQENLSWRQTPTRIYELTTYGTQALTTTH